jgi:uncharacterized OB-fold protein
MSNDLRDFDAATGVICSKCGREVFRNRDGMCLHCWTEKEESQITDPAGYLVFPGREALEDIIGNSGED